MSEEGAACPLPGAGPLHAGDLYGTDDLVHRLLSEAQTWFVVGLSTNTGRAAHGVAEVLLRHGKTVVPVHPKAQTVFGQRGFTTVEEAAAVLGAPDVVDCFVNSALVGPVVDSAIAVGAGAVWLQLGVVDEAAAARARAAGLDVVMDRCPAAEWSRLRAGR
jgi:predicted CoA-binding protein